LGKPPYRKMIPLREIIASSYGIKSRESQTVERIYQDALGCGLSEREILLDMSESDLRSFVDHRVGEGIMRVRESRYKISPGYDGIYGQLEIFDEKETAELLQMNLFDQP
jgi:PHP family Zn ribbon phosphoesterase